MSKVFTKAGIVKFSRIGKRFPSKVKQGDMVTAVYFQTQKGEIVYYDAESKWEKPAQLRFHNDIIAASEGKNSGYFQGLTIEQKTSGNDYYLEANPKYELLTIEQAELLK